MPKRKTKNNDTPATTGAKKKYPEDMTAREYFATSEGQLEEQKIADDMLKIFFVIHEPTLGELSKIADDVYNAIASSGILDAIKSFSEYSELMKISYDALMLPLVQSEKKEMVYFAPPRRDEPAKVVLGDEQIHQIIAELNAQDADRMSRSLEKLLSSHKGWSNPNVFILKRDGALYRASDPRQSHSFRDGADGGMRLAIIKALVGQPSLTPTRELLEKTEYKNADSLRKAIGEINRNVRTNFKLKMNLDDRFIVSRKPSGYIINSQYEIIDESGDT